MKQEVMLLDTYPDLMNRETGEENEEYDDTLRLFTVPTKWLASYLRKERMSMREFMSTYTWDDTYFLYKAALYDGVVLSDKIAPR